MRLRLLKTMLILITLSTLGSGCAQKIYIKSDPHGAMATLDDGRQLATTPLTLKLDAWAWSNHTITLTKEGYKPTTFELDAQPNAANIAICAIGACMLWMSWPICVAGKYRNQNFSFTLKEDNSLATQHYQSPSPPPKLTSSISFTPEQRRSPQ